MIEIAGKLFNLNAIEAVTPGTFGWSAILLRGGSSQSVNMVYADVVALLTRAGAVATIGDPTD